MPFRETMRSPGVTPCLASGESACRLRITSGWSFVLRIRIALDQEIAGEKHEWKNEIDPRAGDGD